MHTPHDERRTERRTTDVSAGWRAEYAAQEVATTVLPDGGEERPGIAAGDRVRDLESDDSEELLVVGIRDADAAEHVIAELGESVASVNPGYPPKDRVAEAVYMDDVESRLDGWRSVEDVRDAVAFDAIASYSFPASRLRAINDEGDGGELEAFL